MRVASRILVCALAWAAMAAPAVSGGAAGPGGGHGGHAGGGPGRAAGRAPGTWPRSRPHRHFRRRFGAGAAAVGLGGAPVVPEPEGARSGAAIDPYFLDPASTGYIPYCDPGSLYYDPESCDEMVP